MQRKKSDWETIKLYYTFLRPYLFNFLLIVVCVLLVEAFTLGDKIILKKIIDTGTEYSAQNLSKEVFIQILGAIALIFSTLTMGRILLRWSWQRLKQILEAHMITDIKNRFIWHITNLSYDFHTTHKTGSLITRVNRGARASEDLTDTLADSFFPFIFQAIFVGSSIYYFDKRSALVVALVVFVFTGYSLLIQYYQRKARIKLNEIEDKEKGFLGDAITNIEPIKYYGKERWINKLYDICTTKTKEALNTYWSYYQATGVGSAIILGVGTFFIMYFPLQQLLNNQLSVGTLAFIYTTYISFYGAIAQFIRNIKTIYESLGDLESMNTYFKISNDIKDKPHAPPLKVESGAINFNKVSFNYGKRSIFKDFSLNIKPHEKVALVGHSGSGKSTFVKLLYRLYDIDAGAITIDSINIADVKQESLRSELAIVPQEAVLFDDTIYNNILFSQPSATKKEVLQAIKFAQLDKIIATFPKKESTIVGQRGIKLSGGEKQRVSIARALLANKKILVLDEATSALDSQTEHDIQADLKRLLAGRTAIIIAHRLSTIMHADKIVVLDKGKIVQIGTHKQLITQPGQYRKLWNLQKGGYIGE